MVQIFHTNGSLLRQWVSRIVGACSVFALTACVPVPSDIPLAVPTPTPVPVPVTPSFDGLVSAQTMNGTKVNLTWNAVDPTIVAFNVYDVTNIFSPKMIKTVRAPASFTSLTGLTSEQFYSFRVRAVDSNNVEDTNTHDLAVVPYAGATGVQVISSTSVAITFGDASDADQVKIYCATGASPTADQYTLVKTLTDVNLTSATLTGLTGGTQYSCRAAVSVGGTIDNNENYVTFIPIGKASQLVLSTQPGSAVAGTFFPIQPVVKLLDVNGNVVSAGPDSTVPVTLSLALESPTAGTLRGVTTVAAVGGVATFTGLYIQEAGAKILAASKPDTTAQSFGSVALQTYPQTDLAHCQVSTLGNCDSNSFVISAESTPSITKSSISLSPTGPLVADGASTYTVTVTLKDQYSNPISGVKPQFSSSNVNDTVSAITANTDSTGSASGAISTSVAGTRTLSIGSPSGLTGVNASATFIPGAAYKLAFVGQPTNSPAGAGMINNVQVAVEDRSGNVVSTDNSTNVTVSISSANNPGNSTLSGTNIQQVTNGVATFNGLGISSIGNGYKLLAQSSGSLVQSSSNSFNVTSGGPTKIAITGASSVASGVCSGAYTVQLQDASNNAAAPTGGTTKTVALSGAGNGAYYSSSTCSGTAVTSLVYNSVTSTKTVYFKDNTAESLNLTATESSMSNGNFSLAVKPTQVALSAPAQIKAGVCSALTITTKGADNNLGNVWVDTPLQITGSFGHGAFYSELTCSTTLSPTHVVAKQNTTTTTIYFKDNTSENVSLSVVDPASSGAMNTTSSLQSVSVLPSQILVTAPATVRAGDCSAAFTVTIKDAAGNAVNSSAASGTPLSLSGLGSGQFYATGLCTGSPLGSSVTVAQGQSSASIYFKDNSVESLSSIVVSDPTAAPLTMASSAAASIVVWPRTLAISAPATAPNNGVCSGAFTVTLNDGNSTVVSPPSSLTVTLGGQSTGGTGNGGGFYSDPSCGSSYAISQLNFTSSSLSKTFYYMSTYPGTPVLTANASLPSPASAMAQGSTNFTVNAYPGWIGSDGSYPWSGGRTGDPTQKYYTFNTNVRSVRALEDAPGGGVERLHIATSASTGTKYLFATEAQGPHGQGARIHMYDYTNSRYVGWTGTVNPNFGSSTTMYPMTGSFYSVLQSPCLSASSSRAPTPGWCQGGVPYWVGWNLGSTFNSAYGDMQYPTSMADDGTYLYVVDSKGGAILRYRIDTSSSGADPLMGKVVYPGGFSGWIGYVGATLPTLCNVSGVYQTPVTGTNKVTPGWCTGGYPDGNALVNANDLKPSSFSGARFYGSPLSLDGLGSLYVGAAGAVYRFNLSTGAFTGWIGRTSSAFSAWSTTGTPVQSSGSGGISVPNGIFINTSVTPNTLTVVDGGNNWISTYNLSTGALIGSTVPLSPTQVFTSNNVTNGAGQVISVTQGSSTQYIAALMNKVQLLDPTSGYFGGWVGMTNSYTINSDWGSGTSTSAANDVGFTATGAVEYDGNGYLLTGAGSYFTDWSNPLIKKWQLTSNLSHISYVGAMGMVANSPSTWSSSSSYSAGPAQDNGGFYGPAGSYVDNTSKILYVADNVFGRIKKIDLATGSPLGWLGVAFSEYDGTAPCGGNSSFYSFTNYWCSSSFAANANQLISGVVIPYTVDGRMLYPTGVTSDGTYLYVTDTRNDDAEWGAANAIMRYRISDGSFQGWVGGINSGSGILSDPPAGQSNPSYSCTQFSGNSASNPNGMSWTPGWCTGGRTSCGGSGFTGATCPFGSGDGHLHGPTAIYYDSGTKKLYVVDGSNHRIARFDAATGAYEAWIGHFSNNTSMGNCPYITSGTMASTNGWCTVALNTAGGHSRIYPPAPGNTAIPGFGFYFGQSDGTNYWGSYSQITGDGTYLYVANAIHNRVTQINMSTGVWVAALTMGSSGWSSSASTFTTQLNPNSLQGIWTDGTNLYVNTGNQVNKYTLSSGTWVGWVGASWTAVTPVSAGSIWNSPGTGNVTTSYVLPVPGSQTGGFSTNALSLSGDSNFIYVSDPGQNRVIRIPK